MEDPRPAVISILRDDLNACGTRDVVMTYPGLQAAWEGEAPPEFVWWFVDTFVGDPALSRRMRDAYHEIGRTFADLERLDAAQGGGGSVSRKVVELVQRRVLNRWFPSSYEILEEARGASATRAAANLKRYTEKRAWLARF